jgi:transposase-like protein
VIFGKDRSSWCVPAARPDELARAFEPTAQSIRTWVAQAERDAGGGDHGLTSAEREELNRVRRENRQLKLEREILIAFDYAASFRERPARIKATMRCGSSEPMSSAFSSSERPLLRAAASPLAPIFFSSAAKSSGVWTAWP